jgi:acyl homoserine lactone synthase
MRRSAKVIDVVTPELYGAFSAELEAMFRLRYRVFKQRLKWDLRCSDGLERDEYDDFGASYLILRDRRERVVGTCRFLPTTGPYMLREVFQGMLGDKEPPCHPSIWEGSRLAVDCGSDEVGGLGSVNPLTREVYCGLVEFGMAMGMTEIYTIYDFAIARFLRRIGCRPKWQGKPRRMAGSVALAVAFDINQEALDMIRAAGNITGSVIRSAPWLDAPRAA